jgi:protein phosphatase
MKLSTAHAAARNTVSGGCTFKNVRIAYAAVTHKGGRQRNEDALQVPRTKMCNDPMGLLFAVADGMGGHCGGKVASTMACRHLLRHYGRPIPGRGPLNPERLRRHLSEAVLRIDRCIRRSGLRHASLADMGTTLSCLVLAQGRSIIAHVGDSRIYRLRHGFFTCLTTDHTLVREMVFEGLVAPEKEARHPLRHLLTRSVGTAEALEWVDSRIDRMCTGDRFLICTDGLHNALAEKQISEILGESGSPRQIADKLVAQALHAGAKDNVSVIVICPDSFRPPEAVPGPKECR